MTDLWGMKLEIPTLTLFNLACQWKEPAILCELHEVFGFRAKSDGRPPMFNQLSSVLFLPSLILKVLDEIYPSLKSLSTKSGPEEASIGDKPKIPLKESELP
jgi:hypothetical protein